MSGLYSVAERKSPKKGRPYTLRPSASLRATCGARAWGALRNSLRAARFARTTAASQFTKHGRSDARAAPRPALLGASRRGPANRTSARAIAALGPACAARGACARKRGPSEAKARVACSAVHPPAGCACGGAVGGWHGRRSAHASCSDSPWLSERRCAAAKRVPRRTPQPPRRRFAPSHREGVADLGSPSFAFFSWRRKKRRCPAGGTSRHPPWAQACR